MRKLTSTQHLKATQVKATIQGPDREINTPGYTTQMTSNNVSARKTIKTSKMRALHIHFRNIWLSDPLLQQETNTSLLLPLLKGITQTPKYTRMLAETVSLNFIPKKLVVSAGGYSTDELTSQSSGCLSSEPKGQNIESQTNITKNRDTEHEPPLDRNAEYCLRSVKEFVKRVVNKIVYKIKMNIDIMVIFRNII